MQKNAIVLKELWLKRVDRVEAGVRFLCQWAVATMEGDHLVFVAKIKLSKIYRKCSSGNLLKSQDFVWLDDEVSYQMAGVSNVFIIQFFKLFICGL